MSKRKDGDSWYQPGANGQHAWGNGPQPKKKCACMEALPALRRGKVRLAARLLKIGIRSRLDLA